MAKPKVEYRYVVGRGYHLPRAKAEKLFTVITEQFNGQKPSVEELLSEARKKQSPIHDLFEWDVTAAAQRHWHQMAQYYLRAIHIVEVNIDTSEIIRGPIRAFVPTSINADRSIPHEAYIPAQRLHDTKDVEYVLRRAHCDFLSVVERYKRYAEFLDVFAPVIEALGWINLEEPSTKRHRDHTVSNAAH